MIYLLLFYFFLVPFEYIQEKIPKGPTGFNYATIMMLVMGGWWFFERSRRERPLMARTPLMARSPLNIPLVLFLVYTYLGMALTSLTIPGSESVFNPVTLAFKTYLQFFNGILFFFLAAALLDSRRKIRHCLWALALAAPFVFRVFYDQLHSVMSWHFDDDLRIAGPFVNIGSNELAAFMLYGALFLGLWALLARPLWERLAFLGAAAMYTYGVLYSYSRGTQLAFLVAAALTAIRYRVVLILLVVVALGAPVLYQMLPVSVRERWEMTRDQDTGQLESSAQSRKDLAAMAWGFFLHNPIIGNGVGSFKLMNPQHMDTHDVYMRTLAEGGVIGLALFMTLWGTILMIGFRLWQNGPQPFDRHYGFCLIIATAGLMIANIFGDRFTHVAMIGHYWILVGIGARLYAHMTGAEALQDEAAPAGEPEASTPASAPPLKLFRPRDLRKGIVETGAPASPQKPSPAGPPALNIVGRPPVPTGPVPGAHNGKKKDF